MKINKNSLQARINNLSSKTGVHPNILLKTFFFDAFLKRLSVSKYCNNFVFKVVITHEIKNPSKKADK